MQLALSPCFRKMYVAVKKGLLILRSHAVHEYVLFYSYLQKKKLVNLVGKLVNIKNMDRTTP